MQIGTQAPPYLILASSSKYRQKLLQQIGLDPLCISPDIDETPHSGESAGELASRLSIEKAHKIAKSHSNAIIIAGDQVCDAGGVILGKPGNADTAKQQLTYCSGREIVFHTGVCVLNSATKQLQHRTAEVFVHFRNLSSSEIERYIKKEPAFDCAGSFKMEGLGISLFKHIRSDDPNALIGLPLITVCEFLRNEGLSIA